MKTKFKSSKPLVLYLVCLILFTGISLSSIYAGVSAAGHVDQESRLLPVSEVADKIRGGLLGQILGNLNGLTHEMKYLDHPGSVTNYVPSLPQGAWTDDDTDFEWVYVLEMQKNRNAFLSPEQISQLWKERINRGIWCSNRYARYLMDLGFKPPVTGSTILNPWAEFNVSGQFLCETFALMAPAMPQTAARIGLNYTTAAISGEPAQVTQMMSAMIASAFIETDINKIIDAGVMALDPQSRIRTITSDIIGWHKKFPDNLIETRRLLHDKYTIENGSERDRNGVDLNTGAIIASLLYGNGDFQESLKHAFNFGWDADCNAATVGTIIGVVYGYNKMMNRNDRYNPEWVIVDRYKNTKRENMPMDETITSFADRIIDIFEMVNEKNGGSKEVVDKKLVYKIPQEVPAPVTSLSATGLSVLAGSGDLNEELSRLICSKIREERARGCYIAVCAGLDQQLSKKYPREWKQASFDLSGYWKVISNIYDGSDSKFDFNSRKALSEKFMKAGFKPTRQKFAMDEIWEEKEFWKDPAKLY